VAGQFFAGDTERFDNQRGQRKLVVVKRELEFSDADHLDYLSLFRGSVFRIKTLF
jgi:hypothetical protein